jgi:hypothetical protein
MHSNGSRACNETSSVTPIPPSVNLRQRRQTRNFPMHVWMRLESSGNSCCVPYAHTYNVIGSMRLCIIKERIKIPGTHTCCDASPLGNNSSLCLAACLWVPSTQNAIVSRHNQLDFGVIDTIMRTQRESQNFPWCSNALEFLNKDNCVPIFDGY